MEDKKKLWMLSGVLAALALAYVFFFTDWISPAPIEIASQVRPVIQQPRFGRKVKATKTGPDGAVQPDTAPVRVEESRSGLPEPANGVAHVTFSLDDRYSLTSIRVFEVAPDGGRGKMIWDLSGKSRPLNSLIYGMSPAGMVAAGEGTAQPLDAGMQYRLEVAAGRRKGTNVFRTINRPPPTE
jgi:hypothetical protein